MNNNWIIKKSPPVECGILDESLKFPSRNIYCVGRNYRDHAKEMGSDPDREQPFFFQKTSDVLVNDGSEIEYPKDTSNFQYEVELVVAISEEAFQVDEVEAKNKVFGYALGVDITKRDLQQKSKDSGKPWFSGKVFYGSAVLSDIVSTKKSIDPDKMRISLSVNGQQKQNSGCDKMIWNVFELISILSQTIPLKAGDLIFTGTPAGVGQLQKGDVVSADLDQPNAISLSFSVT
jgi:fumarylpyruvate hydrolase